MDISTVLLSIQSLLDNDPLLNEPGFHKKNKHQIDIINNYNDVIFFENINSLLIKNYLNIPENFIKFKDIIVINFKENYLNIYNNILKYDKIIKGKISIPIYNIRYIINYKELLNNYIEFCNKLNLKIEIINL